MEVLPINNWVFCNTVGYKNMNSFWVSSFLFFDILNRDEVTTGKEEVFSSNKFSELPLHPHMVSSVPFTQVIKAYSTSCWRVSVQSVCKKQGSVTCTMGVPESCRCIVAKAAHYNHVNKAVGSKVSLILWVFWLKIEQMDFRSHVSNHQVSGRIKHIMYYQMVNFNPPCTWWTGGS